MTAKTLAEHKEDFKQAMKGVSAQQIASAMTNLTNGVNYSRCNKEMLSSSYAERMIGRGYGRKPLSIDDIKAECERLVKANEERKTHAAEIEAVNRKRLHERWRKKVALALSIGIERRYLREMADASPEWSILHQNIKELDKQLA